MTAERRTAVAQKLMVIFQDAATKHDHLRVIFSQGPAKKTFDISRGKIVNLESSEVLEKFSPLLIVLKFISQDDLRHAVTGSRKGWETDEGLIKEKNLTPQQVKMAFSMQLSRMVNSLLDWPTINFKVTARESTNTPLLKEPLPLEELHLHLLRMHVPSDFVDHLREKSDCCLHFVAERISILKSLPINSQEGLVLSRLKGMQSPAQIIRGSDMAPARVYEILSIFFHLKFLSFDEVSKAVLPVPAEPLAPSPSVPVSPVPGPVAPVQEITGTIASSLDDLIVHFRDLQTDLGRKDYYSILDVCRDDFSLSQLKTNYYTLAKRYHPDKYRKYNSEELNELLEIILNQINSAYECLKDSGKKQKYDDEINSVDLRISLPGGVQVQPSLNTEEMSKSFFQQGRSLVTAQKYAEAIPLLRRAVQIKPDQPDYHAYLGFSMSKTVQFRKEAEFHFLRSIELNPMNVNTHLHLGKLYKEARMYNKAMAVFQQALQWSPENRVALQEIEEIIVATGKKPKGFFNNLFKK